MNGDNVNQTRKIKDISQAGRFPSENITVKTLSIISRSHSLFHSYVLCFLFVGQKGTGIYIFRYNFCLKNIFELNAYLVFTSFNFSGPPFHCDMVLVYHRGHTNA